MKAIRMMNKTVAMAALGLTQTFVMAQVPTVTVTYAPDATAIPSLSQWGMIVMSLLLAISAVFALRKGKGSSTILSLALGAVGLLAAGTGTPLANHAWATASPDMTNPAGGVTSPAIPLGNGVIPITNLTGVRMRIVSVSNSTVENAAATTCKTGVIVAPNASCNLDTGPI